MNLRTAISVAITLLQTIASYTATTIDDQIVKFLQAVSTSDSLLQFLESLLAAPAVQSTRDADRTQNIQLTAQSLFKKHKEEQGTSLEDAVTKVGIPLPTFWSLLPLVVRLLLTVLGERHAKT